MSDLQWYDYVRMLHVLACLSILYAQLHRAMRLWSQYNSRLKDYWWAYSGAFFVMGEGSVEAIIKNVDATGTFWLKLLVAIIGLVAVYRARKVGEYNTVHKVY